MEMIELGMQLILCFLGLKEIISAKKYYDEQKKKFAIASLCTGIFVIICAILSITYII